MKKCRKCGEFKEHTEFHRDRSRKDGLKFICKTCRSTKKPHETKWKPDNAAGSSGYRESFIKDKRQLHIMQQCAGCTRLKWPEEFHLDRTKPDRNFCQVYCKECRKKYLRGEELDSGARIERSIIMSDGPV